MEIYIKDNRLILNAEGADIDVKFTLGAGIELENKYTDINEVFTNIKKVQTCVDCAVAMINEAVKKYNSEYGGDLKPINGDILSIMLKLESIEDIIRFKIAVANTVLSDSRSEGEGSGDSKKK